MIIQPLRSNQLQHQYLQRKKIRLSTPGITNDSKGFLL